MDHLVEARAGRLLQAAASETGVAAEVDIEALLPLLRADLEAYCRRDPAVHGDAEMVVSVHAGFTAQLCHRLAHVLYCQRQRDARLVAHHLQYRACGLHGVDIHPAAMLGPGVVLDHPHGITIGETAEVGAGCYLLGGTILGARGIAGNAGGRRHPRLGRYCQLGQAVRVFGPVDIGDHVFIAPCAVITESLEAGTIVTVVTETTRWRRPTDPTPT